MLENVSSTHLGKMRKDKLYAFGSLALFVWISMTYFLFVHRPNAEAVRRRLTSFGGQQNERESISQSLSQMVQRVNEFEVRLKRTSDENRQLLLDLQEAVKESRVQEVQHPKNLAPKLKPLATQAPKEVLVEPFKDVKIAVLMFACNRVTVSKALDSLLGN